METKITSHIIKGLLLALVLIVISVIGQLAGLILQSWYGWISIVVFVGGIIWATIYYGQQMNNNVTFGNLFAHGFKTTAVTTCIVFIYTLLSIYVLFPGFIDQIVEKGMEKAREQGKVTEEQLQQGAGMIKKVTTITLIAGGLIGNLIVGLVGALIGAGAAKKNPNPTPFAE